MAYQPSLADVQDLMPTPNAAASSAAPSATYTPSLNDVKDLMPVIKKENVGIWGGISALAKKMLPPGNIINDINDVPSAIEGVAQAGQSIANYGDRAINSILGTKLSAPSPDFLNKNNPQSITNPFGYDQGAVTAGNIGGLAAPVIASDGLIGSTALEGALSGLAKIPGVADAIYGASRVPGISYLASLAPQAVEGAAVSGAAVANDPNSSIPEASLVGGLTGAAAAALPDVPVAGRYILNKIMGGKGEAGAITPDEFQANMSQIPTNPNGSPIKAPIGDVANSASAKSAYAKTQVVPFSGADKPYVQLNKAIRGQLSDVVSNLDASPQDTTEPTGLTPNLGNIDTVLTNAHLQDQLENFRTGLPAPVTEYPNVKPNLSNLADAAKTNYMQQQLEGVKANLNPNLQGSDLDNQVYQDFNNSYQTSLQNEKNSYANLRQGAAEIDNRPEFQSTTQTSYVPSGLGTKQVSTTVAPQQSLIDPTPITKYLSDVNENTTDPENLKGISGFLGSIGNPAEGSSTTFPLQNMTHLLDLRQAVNKRYGQVLGPDQGYQRGVLGGLKGAIEESLQKSGQYYPDIQDLLQKALQSHKDTLPFEQMGLGNKPQISPFKKRYDTRLNTNNVANGIVSDYFTPSKERDSVRDFGFVASNIQPETRSAISHNFLFPDSERVTPAQSLKKYDSLGDDQKTLLFGQHRPILDEISKLNKSSPSVNQFSMDKDTKLGLLHNYLFGEDPDISVKNTMARYNRLNPEVKQFLLDDKKPQMDGLAKLFNKTPSFKDLKTITTEQQRNNILANHLYKKMDKLDPAKMISNYESLPPHIRKFLAGSNKPVLDNLASLKKQYPKIFEIDYSPRTGWTGSKTLLGVAMLHLIRAGDVAGAGLPTVAAQATQRFLRSDFLKNQYLKSLQEEQARIAKSKNPSQFNNFLGGQGNGK